MEVSLPKTGNHQKLFADCGMDTSATKDQITTYLSKMMVQFLIEYEDDNGKIFKGSADSTFGVYFAILSSRNQIIDINLSRCQHS